MNTGITRPAARLPPAGRWPAMRSPPAAPAPRVADIVDWLWLTTSRRPSDGEANPCHPRESNSSPLIHALLWPAPAAS